MSARQSAATKWEKERENLLEEARLLDLRRQAQIATQVDTINRLLEGQTYDQAFRDLTLRHAEQKVRLDEAEAEISRLRAELKGD